MLIRTQTGLRLPTPQHPQRLRNQLPEARGVVLEIEPQADIGRRLMTGDADAVRRTRACL